MGCLGVNQACFRSQRASLQLPRLVSVELERGDVAPALLDWVRIGAKSQPVLEGRCSLGLLTDVCDAAASGAQGPAPSHYSPGFSPAHLQVKAGEGAGREERENCGVWGRVAGEQGQDQPLRPQRSWPPSVDRPTALIPHFGLPRLATEKRKKPWTFLTSSSTLRPPTQSRTHSLPTTAPPRLLLDFFSPLPACSVDHLIPVRRDGFLPNVPKALHPEARSVPKQRGLDGS